MYSFIFCLVVYQSQIKIKILKPNFKVNFQEQHCFLLSRLLKSVTTKEISEWPLIDRHLARGVDQLSAANHSGMNHSQVTNQTG